MANGDRVDVLVEGDGEPPEAMQHMLAATDGVDAFVSQRKNAAGQAAWTLFVEFAPAALPFVIEAVKLLLGRSRPTKIKVGSFEVENPTSELIEEALRRSRAEAPGSA